MGASEDWGSIGMEWMYFACEEDMNLGVWDGIKWTKCFHPQVHMSKFSPKVILGGRAFGK